jgi:hypothetical protein
VTGLTAAGPAAYRPPGDRPEREGEVRVGTSAAGADLSALEARRIALAAQGFPRHGATPGVRQLRALARRLRVFQIDPINVLVRSQYLPAFSRLGPYPRPALDALAYQRGELFEYVGHEWSLLPVDLHPLFRWRMHAFAADPRWVRHLPPGYPDEVVAEVAERGPLAPNQLSAPGRRVGRFQGAPGKQALTWLTQSGRLAVAGRRGGQPVYDLTERVIPATVLAAPTPDRDDARRDLLAIAAQALGVATAKDLAVYFLVGLGVAGFSERTAYPGSVRVARLVDDLVEEGRLEPVSVQGWDRPALRHPAAPAPSDVDAAALLSPFDPLIWDRDRTQRLFGFRYRSEIYTPAVKREYGYYVLPFLLGDSLVARVDLRADRAALTLVVLGAFAEPGVDPGRVAAGLGPQLWTLAGWLDLEAVTVAPRGDLADHLSREVAGRTPGARSGPSRTGG